MSLSLLRLGTALGTALVLSATAVAAQDRSVNVVSWGGAYAAAQLEAFAKPFEAKTGIKVNMIDAENPAVPIKAEVEAGNVTTDVASVEYADAVRLCDEGKLEPVDEASLAKATDGSAAKDDFLPGTLDECFVATDVFATIFAYDTTKFPNGGPTTIADFFDTTKFPGKRAVKKGAKAILEMALMADGVPAAEVYATLGTPEGVDRAFKKLDTIKDQIVWWEAGAQPVQLLADGEVAMAIAYNGRIFDAAVGGGKPFKIVWDGQVYEFEGWVIPKGAPHLAEAKEFVAFSTTPEQLAASTTWISYGPPRKSSAALVKTYKDGTTPMAEHLPTSEVNQKNALASDIGFWVDHDGELNERFGAWLAK